LAAPRKGDTKLSASETDTGIPRPSPVSGDGDQEENLIFVSIIAASYHGIPPDKTDQASALINAARNTGGSIGISLASNVLAHREQFHQSRLVESVIPSSAQYQDTLQQVTSYFAAQGSSLLQAQQQAIQWIGQQVQMQASFLAYMDAFWVLALISLAAVPLALVLRKVKQLWPSPRASASWSLVVPRVVRDPIPYALEADWPVGAAGLEPPHLGIKSGIAIDVLACSSSDFPGSLGGLRSGISTRAASSSPFCAIRTKAAGVNCSAIM
jgi:hypothetical protein